MINVSYLIGLPTELQYHIFSFLDPISMTKISSVCIHFREISRCNLLWKKILQNQDNIDIQYFEKLQTHLTKFNYPTLYRLTINQSIDWKQFFIHQFKRTINSVYKQDYSSTSNRLKEIEKSKMKENIHIHFDVSLYKLLLIDEYVIISTKNAREIHCYTKLSTKTLNFDELIQDIICIPKKYPFTNSDYLIVSTIQSSDPTIIMKLYLIDLSKFIKINVITIKNLPEWNNTSRIIDMNPKHPRIQYSTFSFELFDDIAEGFERYLNEEDVNSTNYNNLEKDFIHLGTFTTCLFDSIISVPILIDLKNIFMDFEQLPCFSRKSIEYILIEYEDAKYCLCGCWIIGNQIIYLRKDGILTITKRNMKNENLSLSSPSRSDTSTFQYQHQLVSDKQLEISSAYLCVDESKSQYMDMIVVINDTTLCCINLLDNIPSVECNSRQNICEMTYRWSHSFKRINSITIDWLHFSCLVNVEKVVFNVNSKNGRFVKRISIPDYATLLSISEENQDLIFSNSCGTVFMK